MRVIFTITANCDDPPDTEYIEEHGERIVQELEDAVAAFIMDADASASVYGDTKVEW